MAVTDLPRRRIVFLGADLNPISIACLEGLSATGKYEILVGLDGGNGGTLCSTLRHVWKRHGVKGVLRRVSAKYKASQRLKRSRSSVGGPFLSLREVMQVHQWDGFVASRSSRSESRARLETFRPELIAVANFSQVLRSDLLSIPSLGAINWHPSLLPKYRGPIPYYWILKNHEVRSGVTVHFIDEGLDSGDIISQVDHEVDADDTESSLRQRSIEVGVPLFVEAVESLLFGTAERTPQNHSEMSYFGFPPRGASQL